MKSSKLVLVLSLVAVATVAAHAVQPANRNAIIANSPQDDKPAEQVNKNIQALKGLSNSQLLTVMHFMRASLSVRCDYCHIAENGKYWMDDKPPKQTARRMIEMVWEINKANFGGQPVVTCNTCHRGQTKKGERGRGEEEKRGRGELAALVSTLLRQKPYDAWHELSYNRAGGKTPGENHADYLPSKRRRPERRFP